MCTLIVAHRIFDGFPVVVAANRDELLDRPSEGPSLRDGGILAPKDLQRGGSWLGVNEAGLFVALTNRASVKSQPGRQSRGDLVMRGLEYKTARDAYGYISQLGGDKFNGFHLIMADQNDMFLVKGNGQSFENKQVMGGLIAVTNLGIGERHLSMMPKRCHSILGAYYYQSIEKCEPTVNSLTPLLDIHDSWSHIQGTCIHQPEDNYGTKSSSIIRLRQGELPMQWQYWHRERSNNDQHICTEQFNSKLTLNIKEEVE